MPTLDELHRRVCDIEYALGGIVNNEDVDLEYSVRNLTGLMGQVQEKLTELGKGGFKVGRLAKKSATRMCMTDTVPQSSTEVASGVMQAATRRSSNGSAAQSSAEVPSGLVQATMTSSNGAVPSTVTSGRDLRMASMAAASKAAETYDNGKVYSVGDKVLFMGKTYEMTERVGAAGFTPTGYPGSWKEVTAGGARKSRKAKSRKSKARKSRR